MTITKITGQVDIMGLLALGRNLFSNINSNYKSRNIIYAAFSKKINIKSIN